MKKAPTRKVLPFPAPPPAPPAVTQDRTTGGLTISVHLDPERIARAVLKQLKDNPEGKAAVIRKLEARLKDRG